MTPTKTITGARSLRTLINTKEHAADLLPHIQEMPPDRLIVSEKVTLESGEIE